MHDTYEWEATPELRWLNERGATFQSALLQQKWVEFQLLNLSHIYKGGKGRRPTGKSEWREVPHVREPD